MRPNRKAGGDPASWIVFTGTPFFVPKIQSQEEKIMSEGKISRIESEALSAADMVVLCQTTAESMMDSFREIVAKDSPELEMCGALIFGLHELKDRVRLIENLSIEARRGLVA